MRRLGFFAYGVAVYALFLFTFLYAIGFIANAWVPKTIDTGARVPFGEAVIVNLALLAAFGLQHSVMARPGFKRWWTRWVPREIERSTYVLATSLVMLLLFWQWRPMPEAVWQVDSVVGTRALNALFAAGVGLVLYATFLIDHFELFGLRQAWGNLLGRSRAPREHFVTPARYRFVRHPLYLGWFLVFWATPVMSVGHLLLALGTSAYILLAVRLEENDLLDVFGHRYARYREEVGMFLPKLSRSGSRSREAEAQLASDA